MYRLRTAKKIVTFFVGKMFSVSASVSASPRNFMSNITQKHTIMISKHTHNHIFVSLPNIVSACSAKELVQRSKRRDSSCIRCCQRLLQ
uniref:Uncharacterized protein n=1 Tax=Arundo donax TaxID=35708 RepID=A0A0A9CBF0_ARUDO